MKIFIFMEKKEFRIVFFLLRTHHNKRGSLGVETDVMFSITK